MAPTSARRFFQLASPALLSVVIGSTVASGQTATDAPLGESSSVAEQGDSASPNRARSHYLARVLRTDQHQATEAALREPLSRRVTVDFNETPLREAIDQIADTIGITIRIDAEALQDHGRDEGFPITISLADVPASMLIRSMLPKDLRSIPRDGHLVVTTLEAAREDPAIWFYPTPSGLDAFEVEQLIQQIVEPDAWENLGGPYSIVGVSGGSPEGVGVSVRAADEIHERILPLLVGLDQAAWHHSDASTDSAPRHVRVHGVPDAAVREALCERLVKLCNESLGDAADPEAEVSEIGTTLVVQSTSPEFHIRASNLISRIVWRKEPEGPGGSMKESF